jgi:hypothetical protein
MECPTAKSPTAKFPTAKLPIAKLPIARIPTSTFMILAVDRLGVGSWQLSVL